MGGRRKGVAALTPLELKVMQVLWQSGPGNVQEVQAKLSSDPPLAYTTVQTVLNTLERKGKVKRTLDGRAYTYRAYASRDKAMLVAVRELVERMFGGSSEDLVMSLIKARQVDPARIAELTRSLPRGRTNELSSELCTKCCLAGSTADGWGMAGELAMQQRSSTHCSSHLGSHPVCRSDSSCS